MSKKLNNLEQKLNAFKNEHKGKKKSSNKDTNITYGIKISVDLVATIIVSIMIGLGIDKLFDTRPIFFLTFIILGILAGFMNLYRNLKIIEEKKKGYNKDG